MPDFLAFDIGSSEGRVSIGTLAGDRLNIQFLHRFPNKAVPVQDSLYWDILYLWDGVLAGLQRCFGAAGCHPESLALDTWSVDFALLDSAGSLLGLPFHYRDSRTDGMLEAAFARVPREEIFAVTGIQFMQISTLYQLLAMAIADSPALRVASHLLTIPDLLNYWLSGVMVNEFTNATTTQCYNPITGTWAKEMLERMGIPSHIFGKVVQPGTVIGSLRADLAEAAGLAPMPIIAPACHDTGSAVAAVPSAEQNFAWISSGTWSIMGVEWPEALVNEQSLAFNITNEGGIDGTCRVSKNIMGLWLVQEARRTWGQEDGVTASYDELAKLAAAAEPFTSVIDVDDDTFLPPGDMPARVRAYCKRTGQHVPEDKSQVMRCIYEGLALKYRWVLEHIEKMLGTRFDAINIVGGGTQAEILSQFTADCTGRTVVTGPVEATAIGNLLMQARALGRLSSKEEMRAIVRNSTELNTYQPRSDARWDAALAKLNELIAKC